ncbi:GatB/YqeY domain-containing protein [Dasania marina]|uniref:GatB/YqeY domain-containing protein n=1 Tax=Dasania marina TaxID=471499 RepID=UPI00037AB4B5|nr:GatB/YqeY domain-containing protein [Dasania marina]|tara:strand:+ start:24221 stop:24670 length:450 start_codon:yes stop_codon:yes gene_type:complete
MTEQTLKARIKDEMKAAMRAKAKQRLTTIRSIQAEVKRIEVDERIDVDDARLLAVLDKMCKQRRDSIQQFTDGDRIDLAEIEQAEMLIIQEFLPAQLSEDEIKILITDAIASTGAAGMQDMGKVMGVLKPKLQGRADMGAVSKLIKASF